MVIRDPRMTRLDRFADRHREQRRAHRRRVAVVVVLFTAGGLAIGLALLGLMAWVRS